MNRCSIVIHSVHGNTYIIATYLQELLSKRDVDARLYRVEDADLHIWANQSDAANEFYEDIQNLALASEETLVKSKMLILGCPTICGNVSAEMKAFMDTTYPLAEKKVMAGKYFACFTSSTHSVYEGAFCLDVMVRYAQTLGMLHVPVGMRVENGWNDQPVNGIVHLAGREHTIRPSKQLGDILAVYANMLVSHMQQ